MDEVVLELQEITRRLIKLTAAVKLNRSIKEVVSDSEAKAPTQTAGTPVGRETANFS